MREQADGAPGRVCAKFQDDCCGADAQRAKTEMKEDIGFLDVANTVSDVPLLV